MRAMLLDQPNQMSLETLDDPKPEEGQVLIKMTHAGICGRTQKFIKGKFRQIILWSWAMKSSEKLLAAIPLKNLKLELGSWMTGPLMR